VDFVELPQGVFPKFLENCVTKERSLSTVFCNPLNETGALIPIAISAKIKDSANLSKKAKQTLTTKLSLECSIWLGKWHRNPTAIIPDVKSGNEDEAF